MPQSMLQLAKFLALPIIVAVGVLAFTAGTASAETTHTPRHPVIHYITPDGEVTIVPNGSDDGLDGLTTAQAEAKVGAGLDVTVPGLLNVHGGLLVLLGLGASVDGDVL